MASAPRRLKHYFRRLQNSRTALHTVNEVTDVSFEQMV
jgi:hypothetical protein